MIKMSVVLSNYNSNEALRNTFVSLSKQKTNFDFEVCFLDDCSEENPKYLYDEFLTVKNKKGVRLKQHVGALGISTKFEYHTWFKPSNGLALEMVSPEAEIIVLMLSDILLIRDDTLQKFYDEMKPKVLQMATIYTYPISPDFYLNFDEEVKNIKADSSYPLYQSTVPPRPYQYCCLVPFYKETLKEIDYIHNTHEIELTQRYFSAGYTMIKSDIMAIHQAHAPRPNVMALRDDNLLNWNQNCPERIFWQ